MLFYKNGASLYAVFMQFEGEGVGSRLDEKS